MEGKHLKAKIKAKDMEIEVLSSGDLDDYISLTDMANAKESESIRTSRNKIWAAKQ